MVALSFPGEAKGKSFVGGAWAYAEAMQGIAVKASELIGARQAQEAVDGEYSRRYLVGAHRTVGSGRSNVNRQPKLPVEGSVINAICFTIVVA